MYSSWTGGKHAGCCNIQEKWCQVVFTTHTKCFTYSHYKSKEDTLKEAEKYREKYSDEHNLTKNKYRYVTEDDYKYIEVKLQNDLIMLCDVEHLPNVEERIWTANKSKDKYTYYVKSRDSVRRDQKAILFHTRVYPDLKEVDHINRNGLDNRKQNIREGSERINANNKKIGKNNTSGIKGVYFFNGSWCAQWVDSDKKRHRKTFSASKYGDEEAKAMAVKIREENKFVIE